MSPMPRTSWSSSYLSTSGASAACSWSPRAPARATMSSSSMASRVASPATMARSKQLDLGAQARVIREIYASCP